MEVRRSGDRAVTRSERIVSRHSFAFGPHYEPGNLGFGVLVAHNEDMVASPGGYDPHPHRDMEIVTWVLSGALEHRDSAGHHGTVAPGTAQRMSAGRGVRHSERAARDHPLHMVQMWIRPDVLGVTPSYEQVDLAPALSSGDLVLAASGRPDSGAAVRLHQLSAQLFIARLPSGAFVELPAAALAHLFVARGSVDLETDGRPMRLGAGDAARLIHSQGERVSAGEPSEILVWALDSERVGVDRWGTS
jgi:redox-sensitive bicupin YhaK (pirin superfamily)